MKKYLLLVLSLTLIFVFSACGKEFNIDDIKIHTDKICTYENKTDYDVLYLAVDFSKEAEEYEDSGIWSDGIVQNVKAGSKSKGSYIYEGVTKIDEPLDDSVKPAKIYVVYRDGEYAKNIDYDIKSKEKSNEESWKIGEWKDEYDKMLPKIDAELFYTPLNDDYEIKVLVYDVDKSFFNDYVKAVKKFGYTENPIQFDSGGIFGYSYSAKNKDGKEIIVTWDDTWKSMKINCGK